MKPDYGQAMCISKGPLYFTLYYSYEVPTTDVNDPDHVIVPIYLREKKSSLTYSPSNLFGQPQLIGLPKNNLTYEKLYSHVLKRLQRYVNPPPQDQVWWKSNANKNINNNNNTNHLNNNVVNGENSEMSCDGIDGATSSKATQEPQSTTTHSSSNPTGGNGEALDSTNLPMVCQIFVLLLLITYFK